MAGIVNLNAQAIMLAQKLPYLSGLTVRLFQNDITPDLFTSSGDFVEANFPGYAPVAGISWGVPFINASNVAESDAAAITWTMTGAGPTNNIYGVYVTTGGGQLIFSQRAPGAPIPMMAVGQPFTALLRFFDGQMLGA